ncbi:polysaccharide biosynthesis tyrosine autokinase [Bacteroidota bacterium]
MEHDLKYIPQEETIDIKKYFLKFLANWYWFLISLISIVAVAYLTNRYVEPVYSVSATVIVKNDHKSLGGDALYGSLDLFAKQKNIQNEIGILTSFNLTRTTIELLDLGITYVAMGRIRDSHLYKNSPFRVTVGEGLEEHIGTPFYVTILSDKKYKLEANDEHNIDLELDFNKAYQYENFYFTISKTEYFNQFDSINREQTNDYYFVINDLNKLAYSYNAKLKVELANREGSILRLGMKGHVAQQEVDFLNTLIDTYIDIGLKEKNLIAKNTVDFIDKQLKIISDTLIQAEEKLELFRTDEKVIDISLAGQAIIKKLEQIRTEKTLIDMKAKYYDYLFEYLKKDDNLTDVMAPSVMGINDPGLTALISDLSNKTGRKAQLEMTARENNPLIKVINVEIQSVRDLLLETIKNIIEATKITQKDVETRLSEIDTEIRKLPGTEREMIKFQRDFTLASEVFVYLQQRRAEAGIIQASNVADNLKLDEARVDSAEMVSPKTRINYIIAVLLGLSIPFLIIVLKDYFNTKIVERSDVEDNTKIPIIGTVSHYNKVGVIPVAKYPKSSISESFRAIRTNLQFSLFEKDQKIITITSTIGKEGKSFCSLNLAAILAVSNKKTLLVGLDLRKPVLHKQLNLPNTEGMTTYLIGKNSYEDIIQPTSVKNMAIVVSGPVPPNPAELFDTEAFKKFIERAKTEFDYIVLDTPPMALVTDALLVSKYADIMLFVIRQNYSQKNVLKFIEEIQSKNQIKRFQILINDVKIPKYYGYKYGYGYGYGYYTGKSYGSGYYVED